MERVSVDDRVYEVHEDFIGYHEVVEELQVEGKERLVEVAWKMENLLDEGFEFELPEELIEGVSAIKLNEVDQGDKNYLCKPICLFIFENKSMILNEGYHS